MSKVSVIIPAYHCEQYIEQAIQSALEQTIKDVEVIVVDDCSTDRTAKVAEELSAKDSRVKLLRNPQNLGPSASRNRAIEVAQGEWIAILDADGWFAKRDRLEYLLSVANEFEADMVADDQYLVEDGKDYAWATLFSRKRLRLVSPKAVDLGDFIKYDLGIIKPLIRGKFINEHSIRYPNRVRYAEDFQFYMQCLLAGAKLVVTPYIGYCYRMCRGSLISQSISLLEQAKKNLEGWLNSADIKSNDSLTFLLREKFREVEVNLKYYRVMHPIKHGNIKGGLREALRWSTFIFVFLTRLPRIVDYRVRRRLVKIYWDVG